jgi:hypothetical protein
MIPERLLTDITEQWTYCIIFLFVDEILNKTLPLFLIHLHSFHIYYYSENRQGKSADPLDIKSPFYVGTER